MLSFSHLDNSRQMLKSAPCRVGDCSRVRDFAPCKVGNCSRVGIFAPRTVGDCSRAGILLCAGLGTACAFGILLRAGFGTAFAWGILLCAGWGTAFAWGFLLRILRHSYGVHPVTLVYQGLRYRLPLPEVFRPVGACCFIRGCATAYPCLRSFTPFGRILLS